MVVIPNDTLTYKLTTNFDGETIIKPINGGKYKVVINVEGYLIETYKKISVDGQEAALLLQS